MRALSYIKLIQIPMMYHGQKKLKAMLAQSWTSTLISKTLFNGLFWFLKCLDFTLHMTEVLNTWYDSVAFFIVAFVKLRSGMMVNTGNANKFSSIFPLLGYPFLVSSRSWILSWT